MPIINKTAFALFITINVLFSLQVLAQHELNVITSLSSSDPMYQGLLKFKEGVETQTNNEVKIRLFVGSQLGSDNDILEQAIIGANVAVLIDGGRLAIYQHEIGILGAPYLARDIKEVREIVTSSLFNEWAHKLSINSGLQILSFNWWQGERHLLTHKKITHPDDLIGVRMRTIGAPVWLETIRSMGATPTPLGWTEVYSALQQKVIDGAEAQHPATWGSRLHEVISHITKTGHINLISGLVGSAAWFQGLSKQQQSIIKKQALLAGDYASNLNKNTLAEFESKMIKQGVIVTEIDKAPFILATKNTYNVLGYSEIREQLYSNLQQPKIMNISQKDE